MTMNGGIPPSDAELVDELIADAGIYQPYTVADVIAHLSSFPPESHVYLTITSDDPTTYRVMEIMNFHDEPANESGPLLSSWIP